MTAALQDVVVLDATATFWASMGAGLLADFGATVIRIDGPAADSNAGSPTDTPHHFELANRNKLSVSIDGTTPQGRDVLERLIGAADVFVTDGSGESFDYATLSAMRPTLVYARASAFGAEGPDRGLPPIDELAAARTGLMPILPQPGQPPVYGGGGQMYSAVMLAFGVMTALWHREATGEGQVVDVSLLGGNMYGASLDLQAFLAIGGERFLHPVSRLDAGNPMSGTLYPTQDGRWVTLTMPDTDRWWPGLAAITGLDPTDERFDSHEKRCETNRLELIDTLERAFATRPAAHWRSVIAERNLSADVIEDYDYVADDPQARRNRFVLDAQRPGDSAKTLGFPLYMSETAARLRNAAPFAGQHTAQVLRELLGYSEDEIAALHEAGAVS
jgi:formyl-CoA transferase